MINKTKQHLIRTLCFATMLTTLASCADDEGTETSNNEKVYTSFVAGSDSITRTQLTESNKVEWEAGDEISLNECPHVPKLAKFKPPRCPIGVYWNTLCLMRDVWTIKTYMI